MKRLALVTVVLALLTIACGPDLEEQFARQIEAQIKDERRCVDVGNAPSPTSPFDTLIVRGVPSGAWHRTLEKAGLGTTEVVGSRQLFRLNEKGLSLVEQGHEWDSRGETYYTYELCYARPVLQEIVSYTEPGDFYGSVYSTVKYAITMEGFPEWATADLHPKIKRDVKKIDEPYIGTVMFVKTNKGWLLETPVKVDDSMLF